MLASESHDSIRQIIRAVDSGRALSDAEKTHFLEEMEAFECWNPFFRLLKRYIDDPERRSRDDYIRLARIQNNYLEDVLAAAETCAHLVQDTDMGYQDLIRSVLPHILDAEDYGSEATILQGIYPSLRDKGDQIACLERLCLIYEKRKYDERMLNLSYEKLITIDPQNTKGLRYFKVLFTQNNEWEEVVRILKTLHSNAKHKNDRFRIAQELATVYLYQLNEPRLALEVIESKCVGSPLDTSTVHYEAYYRLRDWAGCLRVVGEALEREPNPINQAILHLRIGELQQKLGILVEAEASFQKSLALAPHFLEPFEYLIEIAIQDQKWERVLELINTLKNAVEDPALGERLDEAKARLLEGLSHGDAG